MKALVTGTPGWLGSALVEKLVEHNKEVKCLVHPSISYNNSTRNLLNLGVEIIQGDITDPGSLKNSCKNVSEIFHCAGMIHPSKVKQFYEINTTGTINLVSEATSSGVEKFIYVSSNAAAIGDSKRKEVSELDPPEPFMHYGLSKLKAEMALNDLHKKGNIKVTIIRPNWLYGIKGPERQIRFLRMVKNGWPIIFGKTKQTHSLCDINNCVQALVLASTNSKAAGQTYYIADKNSYELLNIYEILANLLKVNVKPKFFPGLAYESFMYKTMNAFMQRLRYRWPEVHIAWEWSKNINCSIKKAENEIGFSPTIDFEEGMKIAIEWYKVNRIAI